MTIVYPDFYYMPVFAVFEDDDMDRLSEDDTWINGYADKFKAIDEEYSRSYLNK